MPVLSKGHLLHSALIIHWSSMTPLTSSVPDVLAYLRDSSQILQDGQKVSTKRTTARQDGSSMASSADSGVSHLVKGTKMEGAHPIDV